MTSIPSSMQAVSIQHPLKSDFSNLSIEERPVPKDLSPTQVLVKVRVSQYSLSAAQRVEKLILSVTFCLIFTFANLAGCFSQRSRRSNR